MICNAGALRTVCMGEGTGDGGNVGMRYGWIIVPLVIALALLLTELLYGDQPVQVNRMR